MRYYQRRVLATNSGPINPHCRSIRHRRQDATYLRQTAIPSVLNQHITPVFPTSSLTPRTDDKQPLALIAHSKQHRYARRWYASNLNANVVGRIVGYTPLPRWFPVHCPPEVWRDAKQHHVHVSRPQNGSPSRVLLGTGFGTVETERSHVRRSHRGNIGGQDGCAMGLRVTTERGPRRKRGDDWPTGSIPERGLRHEARRCSLPFHAQRVSRLLFKTRRWSAAGTTRVRVWVSHLRLDCRVNK